MKIKQKLIWIFLMTFIFSSIFFYVGLTLYRQWEFQRYDTQNHVSIALQKQKDIENPYTPDQSKLDFNKFNDRILIDRNTKDINALSQYFYDYILLGDEIVENNNYNLNIIIRFFDVYAKQFSNKELKSDVWFSYSFVYSVIDPTTEKISALDPTSEKTIYLKLNDYVTMWEKKGGKREGNGGTTSKIPMNIGFSFQRLSRILIGQQNGYT